MQIVITEDEILARFTSATIFLAKGAAKTIQQGLRHGGDKTKTIVLHELQEQTSVRKYGTITKNTAGYMYAPLAYAIRASGRGLPAQEFEYTKPSRSSTDELRESRTQHWRLQISPRGEGGHWGKLREIGGSPTPVVMSMWGQRISIVRSRIWPNTNLPIMQRIAGKRGMRAIFGPSLPEELVRNGTADAFEKCVKTEVLDEIERRMVKLLAVT